jgi:hypothetical protein
MPSLELARADFLQVARDFAVLNPHLSIHVQAFGEKAVYRATAASWPKWRPSDPTSAWWYGREQYEHIVAAYLADDAAHGRDRPVREFIAQFRGLSGSAYQKAVLDAVGMARTPLSELASGGQLDSDRIALLHRAMKTESNSVPARLLGILVKDHLAQRMEEIGGDTAPWRFRYKKLEGVSDGLPWLVEAAFAYRPGRHHELITGVNWAPAFAGLAFGQIGRFQMLSGLLSKQYCGWDEPVLVVVHLAHVRPHLADHGKSVLTVGTGNGQGGIAAYGQAVLDAVTSATSAWAKEQSAEERQEDRREQRRKKEQAEAERQSRRPAIILKAAVFLIMEDAIAEVSGQGRVSAFPSRNLYYAARKLIQAHTAERLREKNFEKILKKWKEQYGSVSGMYRDPRGFLLEPRTGKVIPLGTREVEVYEKPTGLYDKILYVEKKGFHEIFRVAQLAERFDLASICAEGYATDAARLLTSRAEHSAKMDLFSMHDAEHCGYHLASKLRAATRGGKDVKVIDLGLGLEEAMATGLEPEVYYRQHALPKDLVLNEVERAHFEGVCDHTEIRDGKEVKVYRCQRVELNDLAKDPDAFIEYVERKLLEYGCGKLVPPKKLVADQAIADRSALVNLLFRDEVLRAFGVEQIVGDLLKEFQGDLAISRVLKRLAPKWHFPA